MAFGFDDLIPELYRVRALRARPPGKANRGRRRRVFAAALQQFDELLGASRGAGPASAPLPLFYALSQAGRAIAAARCADDKRWEFAGHGLTAAYATEAIGSTTITRDTREARRDAFSVVGDATHSPPLTRPVTVAQLWRSIPGLDPVEALGGDRPGPFSVSDQYSETGAVLLRMRPRTQLSREAAEAAFRMALPAYPGAQGAQILGAHYGSADEIEGWSISIPTDDGWVPRESIGESLYTPTARYLRPALNDAGDLPSTLMSWWALLFALSHLARYVPAAWTDALDRDDQAAMAVPIEKALDSIGRTMPRLVVHAITGEWS